jgi:hypothetical protein
MMSNESLMSCRVHCKHFANINQRSRYAEHVLYSRTIEREKHAITIERDRQNVTIRTMEDSLHGMEKQELSLESKLHGKEMLEENIAKMRNDIGLFAEQIKVRLLISCLIFSNAGPGS